LLFDRDPNEPRVQKTDYGTVKEKTRYRGLNWETYETGSQLYLSISKFLLLCLQILSLFAYFGAEMLYPDEAI
jgi:hypothetical protein